MASRGGVARKIRFLQGLRHLILVQALHALLRLFVDVDAAPAIWISGLALDVDIPPTPALPGDFRLPVSEARVTELGHGAWLTKAACNIFHTKPIQNTTAQMWSDCMICKAWLLGLARCLGIPYGMLGSATQLFINLDYLHADATQPATGHLALPVLSLPFPVSPISRC